MEKLSDDIVIYQGDCKDIMRRMPDKSIDLLLTDPPYNFGEKEKLAYQHEFLRLSKGAIIVFCPPENQWGLDCDQYLFWVKPISTKNTSKSYSRFVEIIQVWNGKTWNPERHWSQYTNVFSDLVDEKLHPYAKPISMITRLIKNHSNEGDLVLDPFAGSFTTGVVCQETKRKFIGIEIMPERFSLGEQRLL